MNKFLAPLFTLFSVLVCASASNAQNADQKVIETIIELDAKFWTAYNKCQISSFPELFTDNVEFYHDKGGATIGLKSLLEAFKAGLCGNPDFRLRREELNETVRVFPLAKGGVYYGAIISGEHVFYVTQKGKREFLDGHARFSQLWLVRDGVWKMARILSYDHGDAKQRLKRPRV